MKNPGASLHRGFIADRKILSFAEHQDGRTVKFGALDSLGKIAAPRHVESSKTLASDFLRLGRRDGADDNAVGVLRFDRLENGVASRVNLVHHCPFVDVADNARKRLGIAVLNAKRIADISQRVEWEDRHRAAIAGPLGHGDPRNDTGQNRFNARLGHGGVGRRRAGESSGQGCCIRRGKIAHGHSSFKPCQYASAV